MSLVQEFKAFALKGNVLDLAVGVIIGGAFGKIVDSVVKDLIMPVIGMVGGSPDFSKIAIGILAFPMSCSNPADESRFRSAFENPRYRPNVTATPVTMRQCWYVWL